MKLLLFLPALLFFASSCNDDNTVKRSVSVVGQAKLKVVPDMVELSLSAYNTKPAMKDAVAETQKAINDILAVCRKYVVHSSDIKVSTISTDKSYAYEGNINRFLGYEAKQVLDVTLKDISKIEQFTEELLATRISKIESIRYNHTGADSIMREVNLLALEDARKTAEKMCSKMNTAMGDIMYLSNYENNPNSQNRGMQHSGPDYEMNLYSKSFGGRGFRMTAEILEFQDVAYASFQLK